MPAIVSGIVNCTIGLLCSNLRDYTAQRLDKGDINEAELSKVIVRERDDITKKLHGQMRKDLLGSLSDFKEGFNRLCISLGLYSRSRSNPNTSQAHTENDEPDGATAIAVKQVCGYAINNVFELIGNLKIASEERYQLSKTSFQEAKGLATLAFNNSGLSTEDKVTATKLRTASRILGGLDDPEAAVHDCLLYLKELQDLPEIQAMFTVWRQKGLTSWVRARFHRKERNVMVESIQAITELLLNLTLQHTNMRTDCLDWPTINTSKEIYRPVQRQKEIMKKSEERRYTGQDLRCLQTEIVYRNCAVTSTGKILSKASNDFNQHGLQTTKPNGECSMFCAIPLENDDDILNKICCFAADENDNVYIVIEIPSCRKNVPIQYKLLTFDKNGNAIADRALDIIEKLCSPQMTVAKDGKLVIYSDGIKSMYICDSTNAEKDYKLTLPLKNVHPDDIKELSFTVSDQKKIIYIFSKRSDETSFTIHIITMDGELKHEVKVPTTTNWLFSINVIFNHVNKTIVVTLFNNNDHSSTSDYKKKVITFPEILLFTFSKTGELLYEF